jgi:hypothetical protein
VGLDEEASGAMDITKTPLFQSFIDRVADPLDILVGEPTWFIAAVVAIPAITVLWIFGEALVALVVELFSRGPDTGSYCSAKRKGKASGAV